MNNIEKLENDTVFKTIIANSHGGMVFDPSYGYKGQHLINLWDESTEHDRDAADILTRAVIARLRARRSLF